MALQKKSQGWRVVNLKYAKAAYEIDLKLKGKEQQKNRINLSKNDANTRTTLWKIYHKVRPVTSQGKAPSCSKRSEYQHCARFGTM
jgi:hypothetical protein